MSDLQVHEGGKVARTKGRPKGESPGLNKSQKKVMKLHDVADIVASGSMGVNLSSVDDGTGIRKLVEINKNNEVRYVDDDFLVNNLIEYAAKYMASNEDYIWTPVDAKACCRIFKAKYAIPEPKRLAWLSDPSFCFKRLPFDFLQLDAYHHPTWDIILGNISKNRQTFMEFIGSIFIDESYCQQYMWMQGVGGDGKGSLMKYLNELMGSTCKPLSTNIRYDHWSESLPGIRVGYFADCRHYGLPTSGEFMTLSGGDMIPINPKGQKQYSIKNKIKFIFASNNMPLIEKVDSNIRRSLVIPFEKKSTIDSPVEFENNLAREGISFINHCISEYLKNNPKHSLLKMEDKFDIEQITSEAESDKQEFLDKYFGIKEVEKDLKFSGQENFDYRVSANVMTRLLNEHFKGSKDRNHLIFKEWLKQRWKIGYYNGHLNGKNTWIYSGIRLLNGCNY